MSAAIALGCAGLGLGCSSSVRSAAAFRCAARRLHSTSRGGRERCERSRLLVQCIRGRSRCGASSPASGRPSSSPWWPMSRSRREPKSSCCVLTLHAMPQRILFLRERHAPDSPQDSPPLQLWETLPVSRWTYFWDGRETAPVFPLRLPTP